MMNWPPKGKTVLVEKYQIPRVNEIQIDVDKVMERVELYEQTRYAYFKVLPKIE